MLGPGRRFSAANHPVAAISQGQSPITNPSTLRYAGQVTRSLQQQRRDTPGKGKHQVAPGSMDGTRDAGIIGSHQH